MSKKYPPFPFKYVDGYDCFLDINKVYILTQTMQPDLLIEGTVMGIREIWYCAPIWCNESKEGFEKRIEDFKKVYDFNDDFEDKLKK